jgi:hypothetical protein
MARAGLQPTRTAGSIIALANQQATSAWADHVRDPTPEAKPLVEENGSGVKEGEQSAAESTIVEPMEVDTARENGHHEPEALPAPPAPVIPRIRLRIRPQAGAPAAPTPEPEPAVARSGRPRRAAANGKKTPAKKKTPPKRSTRSQKRKASDDEGESEAEESGGDEPVLRRSGQRNSPPPPAPSGRVLRSRAVQQSMREPSSELSEE